MNSRFSRFATLLLGVAVLSPALQAQTPSNGKVTRDPFVNLVTSDPTIVHQEPGSNSPKPQKPSDTTAPLKPIVKNPEPVVVAPQVSVQGIVLSASGNQAIVRSPKQTYLVKAGDKLGDYRVEEVQPETVVFRYKDKSFSFKMQDSPTSLALASKKK